MCPKGAESLAANFQDLAHRCRKPVLMIPERLLDGPARIFANQCRRVMYAARFGKVPLEIPRGCGSAAPRRAALVIRRHTVCSLSDICFPEQRRPCPGI